MLVTGKTPVAPETILARVQDGLAQEIKIMLDEGVVPEVQDIDLCLILGAGWPFIDGGASPYLDREGRRSAPSATRSTTRPSAASEPEAPHTTTAPSPRGRRRRRV